MTSPEQARAPVPFGSACTGPVIPSYDFRPCFLLAGGFAFVSMAGWIAALALSWDIGGSYDALAGRIVPSFTRNAPHGMAQGAPLLDIFFTIGQRRKPTASTPSPVRIHNLPPASP